jgi:nucleotide-binding universal stress UspA family protein
VLVTPASYRQLNNILVAYDGSIESSNALKFVCAFFGKNCQNIKIVYNAQDEEKGRELAAEIAEIVTPYNLKYEGVWLHGEAAKEILSFAQRTAMDIIVMGAFGHSRLHDMILGSTAAYIIRNSTVPILLHR